jgi:protein disulfide-isomerase A6
MEQKYYKYKQKYLNLKNNNSGSNTNDDTKNTLYLFKAEWCGYCQRFKPTWNALQNDPIISKSVNFVTFDSNEHKKEMEQYGIQGFPTIMLKNKNKVIDYNGDRNIEDIKNFITKYN